MSKRQTVGEIRQALADSNGRRLARLLRDYADDERQGVQAALSAAGNRHEADRCESRRIRALYAFEDALRDEGIAIVAGVDEVGRGALAGPLTAAAVVLSDDPRIDGLDDSKRLLPEKREIVAEEIRSTALAVSVAHISNTDLDNLGMTEALRRVMQAALAGLGLEAEQVLVDGLPMRVHPAETSVVKGDSTVAAIAAASIVAKVSRDALMREAATEFPGYGFDEHKGYSTAEHLQAIEHLGLTPIHRRSFAPCAGNMRLF